MKRILSILMIAAVFVLSGVGAYAADVTTEKHSTELAPEVDAVDFISIDLLNRLPMAKAKWFGSEIAKTVAINCPGCKEEHTINVDVGKKEHWRFNKDMDNPTFEPSLLVKTGYYANKDWKPHPDDLEWAQEYSKICHSFIKNGQIKFLNDSTHSLAGLTVDLVDV